MTKQTGSETDSSQESYMSKLAKDYNAIDLSGSRSSLPFPEVLEQKLLAYLKSVTENAPAEGAFELRKALAGYIGKRYFRSYSPSDEITITAGGTQAIFTAIASSVKEGDEAIIFEPSYGNHATAIEICGARPVFIKLKDAENAIDWVEVQKAITTRTKLILICTPHNILGSALMTDDMENLQKLINGTKIRVISDESLSEMAYPSAAASSAAFYPRLADSTFIVGSLSHSLGVPSCKIGYCLAPKTLMERYRKIQRAVVSSVNHPFQLAIADHITHCTTLFPNMELLERNRNAFVEIIRNSKFRVLPSAGGSYLILNYSAISTARDVDFAELLVREQRVAVAPISPFNHDKTCRQQVRINLAAEYSDLVEAASRLAGAFAP